MSERRTSNCCDALPYGELEAPMEMDGQTYVFGRCSACMDGAEFWTEEQWNAEDAEIARHIRSYDEGMHMGGDKYNDTMFGAGDELQHEREDE